MFTNIINSYLLENQLMPMAKKQTPKLPKKAKEIKEPKEPKEPKEVEEVKKIEEPSEALPKSEGNEIGRAHV